MSRFFVVHCVYTDRVTQDRHTYWQMPPKLQPWPFTGGKQCNFQATAYTCWLRIRRRRPSSFHICSVFFSAPLSILSHCMLLLYIYSVVVDVAFRFWYSVIDIAVQTHRCQISCWWIWPATDSANHSVDVYPLIGEIKWMK